MIHLFIDTSSERCLLSITDGDAIVATEIFRHKNLLASTLIPQLQTLLQRAALTLADLRHIAVGVGPGSYTGTRVGVIVAKSLGFALDIPVRGFCSLLLYLPQTQGAFTCFSLARSGEAFSVHGTKSDKSIALERMHMMTQEDVKRSPSPINVQVGKESLPRAENLPLIMQSPPQHAFEQQAELLYFKPLEANYVDLG